MDTYQTPERQILVVDDDPDMLNFFELVLEEAGADVIRAHDGAEALAAAAEHRPNLVLTDLTMPGMDGIEMTRRLRQSAWTRKVPVVAVTGHVADRVSEGARQAGCDEVISKACTTDRLMQVVNRYAGRRIEDRIPQMARRTPRSSGERRRTLKRHE